MAEETCKLKNVVIFYKGVHYTNANITDKVATAFLKAHPGREQLFVTYPKGYEPKSDESKLIEAKKGLGKANVKLKAELKDLRNAEKAAKVDVEDTRKLREAHQEAVDLIGKADDDKKEALQKEADKIEKEIAEIEGGRKEIDEAVIDAQAKVEEAEADVDKFNSLLKKREK